MKSTQSAESVRGWCRLYGGAPPCLAPADPDGIGLCPDCRQEIIGGTA